MKGISFTTKGSDKQEKVIPLRRASLGSDYTAEDYVACPNCLGYVIKDDLYVHCSNHSLDLALQQVGREVTIVADTLVFVREVSNTMSQLKDNLFLKGCSRMELYDS